MSNFRYIYSIRCVKIYPKVKLIYHLSSYVAFSVSNDFPFVSSRANNTKNTPKTLPMKKMSMHPVRSIFSSKIGKTLLNMNVVTYKNRIEIVSPIVRIYKRNTVMNCITVAISNFNWQQKVFSRTFVGKYSTKQTANNAKTPADETNMINDSAITGIHEYDVVET